MEIIVGSKQTRRSKHGGKDNPNADYYTTIPVSAPGAKYDYEICGHNYGDRPAKRKDPVWYVRKLGGYLPGKYAVRDCEVIAQSKTYAEALSIVVKCFEQEGI